MIFPALVPHSGKKDAQKKPADYAAGLLNLYCRMGYLNRLDGSSEKI